MQKRAMIIAVTGGAGQLAYSTLFRLANGDLLGPDQLIRLHIIDLPEMRTVLEGVRMELEDCTFPLLEEIKIGSDLHELYKDADYAFLLGAKPRGPGMERSDLLADNGKIFIDQGRALNEVASRDVRVLVVGNPCNTNCLIAIHHAPDLAPTQFQAMTRLDQNRAQYQIAKKAMVSVKEVTNVTIWGNHSSTLVPDLVHTQIKGLPALDEIEDQDWIKLEFPETVQKRGAAIINKRGKSSAASASHAAIGAMKSMIETTRKGEWFSSGIWSNDNPYGIARELVFSFPLRLNPYGKYEIVQGLDWDEDMTKKIRKSEQELLEERDLVKHLLQK